MAAVSTRARRTATEPTDEPLKRYSRSHGQLSIRASPSERNGQQLEVERELLHQEQRQHLLHDLPPEDLQPHLRVADVEPEQGRG